MPSSLSSGYDSDISDLDIKSILELMSFMTSAISYPLGALKIFPLAWLYFDFTLEPTVQDRFNTVHQRSAVTS